MDGQQYQSTLKQVASSQQEVSMTIRQEYVPPFPLQSWKEVIELCEEELIRDYPEGLWFDPAETEIDTDL